MDRLGSAVKRDCTKYMSCFHSALLTGLIASLAQRRLPVIPTPISPYLWQAQGFAFYPSTGQMVSDGEEVKIVNEDEWLLAMEIASFSCFPMAMKAALELDVLEIIARAGPGAQISPSEIVNRIPTSNPDAAVALDRILRVLAAHSVLSSSVVADPHGKELRVYGLTPLCKYFLQNEEGVSLAPLVLMNQDRALVESWYYLKDAVLEGCEPFTKAHGMNAFEYPYKDPAYSSLFNTAMAAHSTLLMQKILDAYPGFIHLPEIVDVGGGIGSTLRMILSSHPHMTGTNFDLPRVVARAPPHPRMKHIGGDMFESVPRGRAIFMKWILHDWSDDRCVRLLKNCQRALPDDGKVIVVDSILPAGVETSNYARQAFHHDLLMLAYNPGGKERTEEEFRELAQAAGFEGGIKPVCCVNGVWVIEFHKRFI